ncbi:MAG TPA: hypothetical protein VMZ00_14215, partial [Sporichthya sp.]|nr:hypothetical protein [Sporichthya sp.]
MIGIWASAGLAGMGALWVGATALQAREDLNEARSAAHELRSQLTSGDLDAAAATATKVATHGQHAHSATRGPAWAVLSKVPVVGEPFDTFRGITGAADSLGNEALPGLVTAMRELDPAT